MDNEIKDRLTGFLSLCDDMNVRLFGDEKGRLKNSVKDDLISYLSFLIYSDRMVSVREIECINYYFEEKYSEADIKSAFQNTAGEIAVPMSLTYFVKMDNDVFTENEMVSTLSKELVSLYKELGMEIICSDRTLAMTEFKDYEDYISMMETYVSAYLKCLSE